MKKSSKILILGILIFVFALILTTNVKAESTVIFTANKTTLKPEEEFEVTLKITGDESVTGFVGELEYDSNNLELLSTNLNSEYVDLGDGLELAAIANNKETAAKELDLYKFKFKTKATFKEGQTKVQLIEGQEGLIINTINTDMIQIEEKTITLNAYKESEIPNDPTTEKELSKIEITKKPTKTTYKAGEKFSTNGMEITATYSDGTTKKVTTYTCNPNTSTALKTTDKKVTISYKENNITKTAELDIQVTDTTVSDKKHQDAGGSQLIIPIIIVGLITLVSTIG